MFEKNMKFSYLIDLYGAVLDENTREIMSAYYYDDLSLAEIAASVGISRQGVRHTIKRGEEQLSFLEQKLSLAKMNADISAIGEELLELAKRVAYGQDETVSARLSELGNKLANR